MALTFPQCAILAALIALWPPVTSAGHCRGDSLAIYRVEFHGHWTADRFPKQFPEFRPPAQFSKTIGLSHAANFSLFKTGKHASHIVKAFLDRGEIQDFESHATLDKILLPALTRGEGRIRSLAFVNSEHSLISLITKIIPSPDWFVGLSGFKLCRHDRWLPHVKVEASPFDAGTQNGLTFTAPTWPTDPQSAIEKITSSHPSHGASSFYYPELDRLPALGYYKFKKIGEYVLSDSANLRKACKEMDKADYYGYSAIASSLNEVIPVTKAPRSLERLYRVTRPTTTTTEKPRPKKRRLVEHQPPPLLDPPRFYDCQVSEWSEWSPCSKSCNLGEKTRTRTVLMPPNRGGAPCPALKETTWCGSARKCTRPEDYFKW